MNVINAGCADPSGTNPAPPLVLGARTRLSPRQLLAASPGFRHLRSACPDT